MPHPHSRLLCPVAVALAFGAGAAQAQIPTYYETQKLISPNTQLFGEFGENFMIDGDVLIAGADEDDLPTELGEVWVFRYDPVSKLWAEEQMLEWSQHGGIDCGGTCHFGHTSAVRGDVISVGVPHDEPWGFMSGSDYIFRYDPVGQVWNEEYYYVAPYGGDLDHIGHATDVADDGNLVAIGGERSTFNGMSQAGRVIILRWDDLQSTWVQEQEITPSDLRPDDRFGLHVSIEGDVLVVGAQGDDGPSQHPCDGSAYVFRFDGQSWVEEQKLAIHGIDDTTQYAVPLDISPDGNRIMVGMPRCDLAGQNHGGSVVVYEYDSGTQTWNITDEFQPSDLGSADDFGAWVACEGDYAVAGSWLASPNGPFSGAAYLFERDDATNTWHEKAKLVASDNATFDTYGWCVAMDGDWIGVGAYNHDITSNGNEGAMYLFRREGLVVETHPMPTGETTLVSSTGAEPLTSVYLAGTLSGLGSTMVPPLGVTLDIAQAQQVGSVAQTNLGGRADWDVFLPTNLSGSTAWFQAVSTNGWTSRVLEVQIQ